MMIAVVCNISSKFHVQNCWKLKSKNEKGKMRGIVVNVKC